MSNPTAHPPGALAEFDVFAVLDEVRTHGTAQRKVAIKVAQWVHAQLSGEIADANTKAAMMLVKATEAMQERDALTADNQRLKRALERAHETLKDSIQACGHDLCVFPKCDCHNEAKEMLKEIDEILGDEK